MNTKQLRALQRLTNMIQDCVGSHTAMTYRVLPVETSEALIFSASNATELRWYEECRDFFAIIGPRGGVQKYDGNITL